MIKTTLEIPDATFRLAKTLAAARGISLKRLFTEALDEKLRQKSSRAVEPLWMNGFGGLADLKTETAKILLRVDEEFEKVEAPDRE